MVHYSVTKIRGTEWKVPLKQWPHSAFQVFWKQHGAGKQPGDIGADPAGHRGTGGQNGPLIHGIHGFDIKLKEESQPKKTDGQIFKDIQGLSRLSSVQLLRPIKKEDEHQST